jgi:hypothetical protein
MYHSLLRAQLIQPDAAHVMLGVHCQKAPRNWDIANWIAIQCRRGGAGEVQNISTAFGDSPS